MLAYARKQNRSTIFEWVEEDKGWLWHAGDYPAGWEKKIKVINIPTLGNKSSTKPKSTKKGDDPYSDVVPFESSPPPVARTRSSVRLTASKSKFTAPQLSMDAPPSSRT